MLDDTQEKPSDIVLKDFDRYKLGTDRPLTAWEEFAMVRSTQAAFSTHSNIRLQNCHNDHLGQLFDLLTT